MKLKRQIPNFLTAAGRKLRISYPECTFLCSNCLRAHYRKRCQNTNVEWIQYFKRFMTNNVSLRENLYGKWWSMINEGYHSNQTMNNRDSSIQQCPKQSENSITKQLKTIREKNKDDQRKIQKARAREREIESQKSKIGSKIVERVDIQHLELQSGKKPTMQQIQTIKQ